jgi:hypothetical protein
VSKSTKEGQPRKSLDKWEQAVKIDGKALNKFREAETRDQMKLIDEANTIILQVMDLLKLRCGSSTSPHHI